MFQPPINTRQQDIFYNWLHYMDNSKPLLLQQQQPLPPVQQNDVDLLLNLSSFSFFTEEQQTFAVEQSPEPPPQNPAVLFEPPPQKLPTLKQAVLEYLDNELKKWTHVSPEQAKIPLQRMKMDIDFQMQQQQPDVVIEPIQQQQQQQQQIPAVICEHIEVKIETLQDLLALASNKSYNLEHQFNINLQLLQTLQPELEELNEMIGMEKLKQSVIDQILYFIQNIHSTGDYKHTILLGVPGTGKTEMAKILGKIFMKMGVLKNGVFKKATRNDLIGGYLGQTAIKTKELVQSCLGGVLFIDEAYSLCSNGENSQDKYAKECIDILCEAMSDYKNQLMVIMAGYEKEMGDMMKMNSGLDSRFIWRYVIEPYNAEELYRIFKQKIKQEPAWKWVEDDDENNNEKRRIQWFVDKKKEFTSYGRDMEKLWTFVKIKHSRRVYGKAENVKGVLMVEDLDAGFSLFQANREKKAEVSHHLQGLYI